MPGVDPAAGNIVGFTVRGLKHLAEDIGRACKDLGPIGVEHHQISRQMAATPGKMILHNR